VVEYCCTAVPDTSVTSFPGSLQLLKPCLLLYQHQYPRVMVYVPLITELEAPTASVAIGFPVIVNPIIGSVTTTLVRVVFPV
jgi:hypothetical protein